MNPERWKYYDVNLDAVREEIAKDVNFGAKNENRDEYLERENLQFLLEEHLKRKVKKPDPGTYDPRYPGEEPQDIVAFDKMVGRDDGKNDDDKELERDGDVLILDPEQIGRHIPGPDFDKALPRPPLFKEPNSDDDELIIEPNVDYIKPRGPSAPDFSKQVGREEKRDIDEDEVFVYDIEGTDPIPNDPSKPRVLGLVDFGRAADRFNDPKDHGLDYLEEEMLDLDPQIPERKVKGFVQMDK
jgi:hypothetical protein